jgi:diadenosine tetraphosphate (Ap4A) HIT family hydrolase
MSGLFILGRMLVSTKPWTEVLVDTKDFTVYKDSFPVTEGHVLFVPKVEDWQHLVKCWEAAYKWGYDWTERGYCEAFNIGQNVGEAAGQTVEYAHVHLIPRRKGDMEDPRGGVRHVIPSKGNYKKTLDKA